jgi:cell shape-determining protein MreD
MLLLKRFGRKIDRSEWHIPAGLAFYALLKLSFPLLFLGAIFLSIIPFSGFQSLPLNFSLAVIYHWSIYRRIPLWLLVGGGALQDIYLGLPLGVHILENLGISFLIETQSRLLMGQNFFTIWVVFGIILAFDGGVKEILNALIYQQFIPPSLIGWSTLFSFLIYPLCVRLFILFHRFVDRYS